MTKPVGDYEIPFDCKGNQQHYPESWRGLEWRPNDQFTETLTFQDYRRARSAAYFVFARIDGTLVTMFLKDFEEVVPHMVKGVVTGTFRFVKRGQNYGCSLMTVEQPA